MSGLALVVCGGLAWPDRVGFRGGATGLSCNAGQVIIWSASPSCRAERRWSDRPMQWSGRCPRIGLEEPGCRRASLAFPGLSVNESFVNVPNAAVAVLHTRSVRIAHLRRSRRAGHRRAPASQVQAIPDGFLRGLPAAAGTGAAGNHRRLQDAGRGSAAAPGWSPGQADPGADDEGHSESGQPPGSLMTSFDINAPQYEVVVERTKVK
ncbi:hypothetical protein ACPA9J_16855 [Pseudomonas aeruginosa]